MNYILAYTKITKSVFISHFVLILSKSASARLFWNRILIQTVATGAEEVEGGSANTEWSESDAGLARAGTRAGSHLMFFSRVPPKTGASLIHIKWQHPQMAAFRNACSNHSPHLLIRSCKVSLACPVSPPCHPVILPVLES